jgi:hypothetical protein
MTVLERYSLVGAAPCCSALLVSVTWRCGRAVNRSVAHFKPFLKLDLMDAPNRAPRSHVGRFMDEFTIVRSLALRIGRYSAKGALPPGEYGPGQPAMAVG